MSNSGDDRVVLDAGIRPDYIGAEVGASLGEAQAGPIAVRAGWKFGGKVENGKTTIHLGPISVSTCTVM